MAKSLIRILVVDDFEQFRRFVASTLAQEPQLHIVGEASDGLEAVRIAAQLQPDLIVLDIGLPKLDGIGAARRIREQSPNSQIVFFSENRSTDIVEEALSTGALGYVLKSDAVRELLAGVKAVIAGTRFLSSSLSRHGVAYSTDDGTANTSARVKDALLPRQQEHPFRHEALFYSDDRQFLDTVSQFLGSALKAGNSAIAIATDSHLDNLARALQAYGVDIAAAVEEGRYSTWDATELISSFTANGVLESDRLLESFEEAILKAANAASVEHPRVALFGEVPDLLWKQGNLEAAIQDEKLGLRLTKRYDVDILCGYSLPKLVSVDEDFVQQICAEHSTVYRP